MKDLYHNILTTQVLNPVVSTTTKTSSVVDLQGHQGAAVLFSVGLAGDTLSGSVYWTLKLQHSDDNSSYSDIATTDSSSAVTSIVVNSMALDETVYSLGYIGSKRYLKSVATPTGTHSVGTPLGMLAIRANSSYKPTV